MLFVSSVFCIWCISKSMLVQLNKTIRQMCENCCLTCSVNLSADQKPRMRQVLSCILFSHPGDYAMLSRSDLLVYAQSHCQPERSPCISRMSGTPLPKLQFSGYAFYKTLCLAHWRTYLFIYTVPYCNTFFGQFTINILTKKNRYI